MAKRIDLIFLLVCILSVGNVCGAAEKLLINDNWYFRIAQNNSRDKVGVRVSIPHTWNNQDALSGKADYYRGIGHYERKLLVKQEWSDRRLFLNFDGVNTIAYLYVNGKFVGEHRGGYASFVFEITDFIKYGEQNTIAVKVSNAPQMEIMPLLGDFNVYGGIYRDVFLTLTDNVCISPFDYGSCGVYLNQKSVSSQLAKVEAKVLLSKKSAESANTIVSLVVRDGAKRVVSKSVKVAMIGTSNEASVVVPFEIVRPKLWQGRENPFMYSVDIELSVDGKVVETSTQPLGLRYFSVDADKGFMLNGKPYTLRGVCRHQDRSEVGNALLKSHHDEDLAIIEDMGANAIRLAHYHNDAYVYNKLDSMGFVVWSEIPFVGPGGYADQGFINSETFKANGRTQLVEMIRQQFNHPSICFWGLFNELQENGDSPLEYIKELNAIAHSEDSSRITTSASNLDDVSINHVTDLTGWNRYDGWYENDPSYLGRWLDATHKKYPSLKISISEYGAGASVYHQQQALTKTEPGSMWHPENWQTYFHIENWKAINSRPFVWGSFIWNMFDFGAAHRTEGDRNGINDKGIVTFDRKEKKDSYYFYRANWNKEQPTLYLCGKRLADRHSKTTSVMVFTSLPKAELFVNGASCGVKQADQYATIIWDGVNLSKGTNNIIVKGVDAQHKITDSAVWKLW